MNFNALLLDLIVLIVFIWEIRRGYRIGFMRVLIECISWACWCLPQCSAILWLVRCTIPSSAGESPSHRLGPDPEHHAGGAGRLAGGDTGLTAFRGGFGSAIPA